ncbi:MAG TPA: hypothetical protein VEW74_06215, partial [Candidatus Nitrosotalea sp.]|nr:hypothetical protein [Candidatus Nitrosotalea sp.]
TRIIFQFTILNRAGDDLGKLELDRTGTFSTGVEIGGWPSLSGWQGGIGHRGYGDNCKTINSNLAALPLLSAHTVTWEIKRVDYADGTSWPQ